MEFHKWPKIENLEAERLRNSRAFQKSWEIENWVVSEKIDGTNIAVNIDHEGYELSSRNQMLGRGTTFYGIQTAVHQIEPIVEVVQNTMGDDVEQITLQGEFFGTKVMGRINYKIPQAFRFFGGYAVFGGGFYKRWPFSMLEFVLNRSGYSFLLIPVVGHYRHFEEALAVSEERQSFLNPDAKAEGIVIQPLDVPIEPDGLIFKKKRADFRENRLPSLKPTDADRKVIDALNAEFKGYITESRMLSVVSKMGRPNSITDFKPFASAIFADAWADFCANHPGLELTAGDEKAVRNVGSLAYFTFQKMYANNFKE